MSNVAVSMKMTAKQSGALYMKNIALSARSAALAAARSSWKLEAGNLLKVLRNKGVVNYNN